MSLFGSFTFSSITSALTDLVDLDGANRQAQAKYAEDESPVKTPDLQLERPASNPAKLDEPQLDNNNFSLRQEQGPNEASAPNIEPQDLSSKEKTKVETEVEVVPVKEIRENLELAKKDVVAFFEDVGKFISKTVDEEKELFGKELEAEKKKSSEPDKKKGPYRFAPWENLPLEDPLEKNACASEILQIAKNRRNFDHAPPAEEVEFVFDLSSCLEVAQVALEKDPLLSRARFVLVPKYLTEEEFWRRYFYRVHIVKVAHGITARGVLPSFKKKTASTQSAEAGVNNGEGEINDGGVHSVHDDHSILYGDEPLPGEVNADKPTIDFASEFHDEDFDSSALTFQNTIRESLTSAVSDEHVDLLSFDTNLDLDAETADVETDTTPSSHDAKVEDWAEF